MGITVSPSTFSEMKKFSVVNYYTDGDEESKLRQPNGNLLLLGLTP